MSLDEHRNQIDAIDSQMVKRLNERLEHALAIGKIKLEQGGSIYAPHREKAVFDRVCSLNEARCPMIPYEPSIVKLCRPPSRWKNRSASLFLAQKPPTLTRQPSANLVPA